MPRPGPINPSAISAVRNEASKTVPEMDPAFVTSSESRSAARAILRHRLHANNDAVLSGASGGLHRLYMELHGKGGAQGKKLDDVISVVNESFWDLLDASSALDLIDGGISLVLRCPGYHSSTEISLEDLTIDVYVSPRELAEGGKPMSERVALLVQDFGAHLALPHLRRFQNRCREERVKALPAPDAGWPILLDGPSHLPAESIPGSGYIRCRCRPAGNLVQDIALRKLGPSRLATVQSKATVNNQAINTASGLNNDARRRGESYEERPQPMITKRDPLQINARKTQTSPLGPGAMEEFIISIGPQTDFLFDRFRLSDTLIPNLRDLAQTVRSSNWEAELASSPAWGLSRIQAAKLSNALLADIQANPVANRRKPRPHFWKNLFYFAIGFFMAYLALVFS